MVMNHFIERIKGLICLVGCHKMQSLRALPFSSCTLFSVYSRTFLMSAEPRIIQSCTTDPFINKSMEDYLFQRSSEAGPLMFLWQNDRTVFIGRNQNPWKECNLQEMEKDGVHLVRRHTGGGAVYQDLGNLCWSFFEKQDKHDAKVNLENICSVLPFDAEVSGRNDITINNRKVSGSAFKFAKKQSLHHGTLLIDVDLDAMLKYLTVNKEKLKSKGVASVKARVVNMKELDTSVSVEGMNHSLIDMFQKKYGPSEIITLNEKCLNDWNLQEFNAYLESMKDWNWRYGNTPKFENNIETRFDWGIMDLHTSSNHGIIEEVKLYSDSLYPELIHTISSCLKGARYDIPGIKEAMETAKKEHVNDEFLSKCIQEYSDWLCSKI